MPILIAGWMDFAPEVAASLIGAAEKLIRDALDEPGCIAYDWSLDPLHPGRVRVFEEWTDEASLQQHFQNAAYRDMAAHLQNAGIRGFEVRKYRCDLSEPVYDETGVPRADFLTGKR